VVFEAEGALWDLVSVQSFVMYQQGAAGRLTEATELRERVVPLASRLGHLGAMFLAVADRTKTDGVMAGDLALVETLAREQIDICERGGLPWLYIGHVYLGLAAHWRGDWDEAERRLRRADELEARGAFSGQSASLLALHLALVGRAGEAVELFEQGRASLPVEGEVSSLGAWNTLFGFAEALYLAGRRDDVAAMRPLMDAALALGEWWDTIDCRGPQTRAGIVAAAGRRWDDAERYYRAAAEQAEKLPNHVEAADVRRFHAMMLLDRGEPGDADRAREMLEGAREAYGRIGMGHHRAIAEALLP
jgi:tetratricopeptide (TPR) repeat protein